ncbi:hypothetical conserved protein [Novosphingobium sp. MBES04]|nr:hypothetical conserved protein [Novosphingobium sp. MBES04]
MHEDIVPAFIALDEAETLRGVEELDDATALADDLCGHAATTATAGTATATRAAAEAAATAAARAATVVETAAATAAEAVTTASKAVAPAETVTTAETVLSGKEGIKFVLSEPIPLVASPSATTSIKTHVYERTFDAP